MQSNKIIKQVAALALVLLFFIGNTPRQWLHDIFANHIDYSTQTSGNSDSETVYKLRYHCQVDHIVIESPFIPSLEAIDVKMPQQYLAFKSTLYTFFIADHRFHSSLRGPPNQKV